MLRVLDLFSGIGGFSLGLERAGLRTVQFVEIDPYCRAVLAHHWPDVPCHDDVRTFHGAAGSADVICGGFPCQDVSIAGTRVGMAGERSGLWSEFRRIVGEVGPRYVLVENVAALTVWGLGEVLGDLVTLGYDTEWHCIPAAYVGAPHRRDRLWLIAYPIGERIRDIQQRDARGRVEVPAGRETVAGDDGAAGLVADPDRRGCEGQRLAQHGPQPGASRFEPDGCGALGWRYGSRVRAYSRADSKRQRLERQHQARAATGPAHRSRHGRDPGGNWWSTEPGMGRVAHGVPARVERLTALGNALVPQIAEIVGRALMRAYEPKKSPAQAGLMFD